MINMFDAQHVDTLQYGLNTLDAKLGTINKNVANVDTPFYKSLKISYEDVMAQREQGGGDFLNATKLNHLQPPTFNQNPGSFVKYQNNMSIRNDYNDVNIDNEMVELSQTNIMFQALSDMTAGEFLRLKTSIRGR